MAWVSCIFTCSYSLSHQEPMIAPIFFFTIFTHVGGSNGVNRGPMKHWSSFLNNTNPILIPENPTENWVQIYSNQKEINYISHSNIRANVEARCPKLHNLLQFSPPFHLWHFMDFAPSFASFCDTRICSCNYNNYFSLRSCLFCKWSPNSPYGRDNRVIVPVYGQTVHGLETRTCQFIFQLYQGSSTSGMTQLNWTKGATARK